MITLPTKEDPYTISQVEYEGHQYTYPNVDVKHEYAKMLAWLEANPKRKKTHSGMPRFVNQWLSKEQERARLYGAKPVGSVPASASRNPGLVAERLSTKEETAYSADPDLVREKIARIRAELGMRPRD